jgi:hypothetical protein
LRILNDTQIKEENRVQQLRYFEISIKFDIVSNKKVPILLLLTSGVIVIKADGMACGPGMVLLDLGKNIHAAIQKLATRRTVDEKV